MKNSIIIHILLVFSFVQLGSAQAPMADNFTFEIRRNYLPLSITKDQLLSARTLVDLNRHFKPSWIRTYLVVDVLTVHDGKVEKTSGNGLTLSPLQKDRMKTADVGADISVVVQYIPENTLMNNEPKELDFTFSIRPEQDARYAEGPEQLKKYLEETAINKIPKHVFEGYKLAVVKFVVDEQGRITDPAIFWPSEDASVDKLLLATICDMPNWIPGSYANGQKVRQEFVFTVGNMESCVVPLLNLQ